MDLLTTLATLAGLVVSIGMIVGAIFKYIVIAPLKSSIDNLNASMKSFTEKIKESEDDRRFLFGEIKSIKTDISNLWFYIRHSEKGDDD